jgi:hypothetical protein
VCAITDEFKTRSIESLDNLGQSINDAADVALARFHSLDSRQRDASQFRECLLIDAEQSAGGAHLGRGDHSGRTSFVFMIMYRQRQLMSRTSSARGGA